MGGGARRGRGGWVEGPGGRGGTVAESAREEVCAVLDGEMTARRDGGGGSADAERARDEVCCVVERELPARRSCFAWFRGLLGFRGWSPSRGVGGYGVRWLLEV